jgi:chorismate mutase
MSNIQIRRLLAKLRDEIQKTELDADTRTLVRELDSDIHVLLDSNAVGAEAASVLKRAKELEANFAIEHPTAERFMREVIEALARMGV